jgi:hypothetical protein
MRVKYKMKHKSCYFHAAFTLLFHILVYVMSYSLDKRVLYFYEILQFQIMIGQFLKVRHVYLYSITVEQRMSNVS